FLVTAFGAITPFRNALNLLPGFSFFRNPALFRLYFLLLLIFFLAVALRNQSFEGIIQLKTTRITISALLFLSLLVAGCNFSSMSAIPKDSLFHFIKDVHYNGALFISAVTQAILCGILLLAVYWKKFKLSKWILAFDL